MAHSEIKIKETNQAFSKTKELKNPKVKNISKDVVERALAIIRSNSSLRKGRESIEYDLIQDKIKYPPILVLSEANKLAGGQELLLSDFGNSTKNAFSILQSLGYIIEKKIMNFSEQLTKFLAQSESGELTTSGYLKQYENFKVKVSFGQGNQARITWIAFLADGQTVSNGIYPVYLYFKKNKLLILAYGVSESNEPEINWSLSDLKSINEYFKENQFGKPERYGASYIFKTYNILEPIIPDKINKDLNDLIVLYKQELGKTPKLPNPEAVEFNYSSFKDSADITNLLLDKDLVIRFITALLTKPFVILTGLSGSGKTKLAQAFSKWICESDDQICLVPVGADWTNREPLLGFPNALEEGRYILPENGVLSLILKASRVENQSKPYFLILDEMNLSHVERYFADFLSAMESGDKIPLHSSTKYAMNGGEVPASICIPKNLFIIGTVNIDETTYMFSPKVLDRASVIEFRVSQNEMNKYLTTSGYLRLDNLKGLGSPMAGSFLSMAQSKDLAAINKEIVSRSLLKFFSELKRVGAEFGYRSASEIMRFSAIINLIEPSWNDNAIIDAAIMQKLLPKVHGSRRKLEPVLKTLALLCLNEEFITGNGFKIDTLLNSEVEIAFNENINYPISFEKIKRMYRRLIDNGFTSYAEA
jgi:5-methylcytosine-specific restriction enzyme B